MFRGSWTPNPGTVALASPAGAATPARQGHSWPDPTLADGELLPDTVRQRRSVSGHAFGDAYSGACRELRAGQSLLTASRSSPGWNGLMRYAEAPEAMPLN